MASIKNVLSLEDKMSPTLSKAEKQALANLKAYDALDKQLKELDAQEQKLYDAGLQGTAIYKDVEQATAAVVSQMEEYENGIRNASDANGTMGMSLTDLKSGIDLAEKAYNALTSVIKEAHDWMEASNKQFDSQYTLAVKMRTSLGATDEQIESMYDYASALQETGIIGDEVLLQGAKMLATSATSVETLKELTRVTADAAVAEYGLEGASEGYTSMANYMQRALEDSASMLVRSKILTKAQADTIDNLSTKQEKEAKLLEYLSVYQGQNTQATLTAIGAYQQAENSLGDLGEKLGKVVTPTFAEFEQQLVQLLTPIVDLVVANADWLIPIFLTLVGVLGTVTTIASVAAVANTALGASFIGVAWPILVVVGAILLAVGALALMTHHFNETQKTSLSVVGVIMQTFALLFTFLYNTIIVPLWNKFAAFANFLGNLFKDPVASIEILFVDLGKSVAQTLNGIAQLMDAIFGTQFSVTTSHWINMLSIAKAEIKRQSEWEEFVPTLDEIDLQGMLDKAYNAGSDIQKNIQDGIQNAKDTAVGTINDMISGLGTFDMNDVVGTDSTGANALKTTTNDDLLKDEDIQLLLDVATRDYKIDYQQITPEITLTFGDIRETADVDEVIDKITEELTDIVNSNLEVSYD